MTEMTQTYKLVFTKDEDSIRMSDLQGFLHYFNLYYLKLNDTISKEYNTVEELILNQNKFKENFKFIKDDYIKYNDMIHSSSNDLLIYELDKHSPLEIILGGLAIALIGTIILSGGEININVPKGIFKVKVNQSIGVTLKELRNLYSN